MKWNMGPKAGKSPRVIGSIEAMPPHLSYIWVYSAVPSHHTPRQFWKEFESNLVWSKNTVLFTLMQNRLLDSSQNWILQMGRDPPRIQIAFSSMQGSLFWKASVMLFFIMVCIYYSPRLIRFLYCYLLLWGSDVKSLENFCLCNQHGWLWLQCHHKVSAILD